MATVYYTAASLDGFIATEDDGLDWLYPLADLADTGYDDFIAGIGALVMGASTYAWLLRHVVMAGGATPGAWPYTQPAWVFSHRSWPSVAGADVRFVQGDVRAVHPDITAAAAGRDVWLLGGGDLVGQFHDAGLLDALIVQVGSVTLGCGKPLLPRRIVSPGLELQSVRRIGPGMAEMRYRVNRSGGSPQ